MMKKTTALALALLVALSALCGAPRLAPSAALAEQEGFSTRMLEDALYGSGGDVIAPDAPASDVPGALLAWEGYRVLLLDYDIFKSVGGSAGLNLFARVVNDTDRKLSLWFNDATVDGVPVMAVPILGIEAGTDTGVDAPEKFYVFARKENKQAGSDAIAAARLLKGSLLLRDADTDEVLLEKEVAIDLNDLEGVRNVNTPRPTDAPTPKPTPKPTDAPRRATAPAYTPASYDFATLKKGSKGQAVRDLQQRLTDLGFLNDKVDGSFGKNTGTACMSFCAQHDLHIQPEATPEMQRLLYSSSAEYYVEPWVPLIMGPEYTWDEPLYDNLDNGTFYTQVVNRSAERTIRGYELYWYLTDVWGERYFGTDGAPMLRNTTLQDTVRPGYIQYTPPITIVPWNWAYTVWVGIHKIVFTDGEVREVPEDEIVYYECPIKK